MCCLFAAECIDVAECLVFIMICINSVAALAFWLYMLCLGCGFVVYSCWCCLLFRCLFSGALMCCFCLMWGACLLCCVWNVWVVDIVRMLCAFV